MSPRRVLKADAFVSGQGKCIGRPQHSLMHRGPVDPALQITDTSCTKTSSLGRRLLGRPGGSPVASQR